MDSLHRLLIDDGSEAPSWGHGRDADVVVIPRGVSSVDVVDGGRPCLEECTDQSGATASALQLDAVDDRQLLMAVPSGARVRLNGGPAPRLARLATADRIHLPAGVTLHVTRERHGRPVAPPAELVGELCGLCRVPLSAQTRVWICGGCGSALHMEGDDVPEQRRLTCARLASSCSVCQGPVEFGSGLDHVPQR